ncbi:MAG: ORF6N domain-containing protein [Patescibacteria group bacterium]|nr:ORF6N domain-containing protein [Patescibacteria group bacterium]MDE1940664.1 ORF6N domain-containing protein [Patescibacteria group bacterium]MDE1966939.1 ORF6N domain-containing protein [Patescibacteria group bacterium]
MSQTAASSRLSVIPAESIAQKIFFIRGQKVMLDSDLAMLYGVSTKYLNQTVRRNLSRFPSDFMFQIKEEELESLRLQFATSKIGRGGRRYSPYAFTEHGVAMISSILHSSRAVEMNILIIRTFIKLREILSSNRELAAEVELLKREQDSQSEHIKKIYKIIARLISEPPKQKGPIGFQRRSP